jgi:hypothetical protein
MYLHICIQFQSYSQPYMGWKINIVDDFNKRYLITAGNRSTGFKPTTFVIVVSAFLAWMRTVL